MIIESLLFNFSENPYFLQNCWSDLLYFANLQEVKSSVEPSTNKP